MPAYTLPKEYIFPEIPEDTDYCVFPAELENDINVYFHGTNARNFESIISDGFMTPKKLSSVSFTNKSSTALGYACAARKSEGEDGCLLMVRYLDTTREGIKMQGFGLYDFTRKPPPDIIGFCIVPASYKFI